MKNGKAGFKGFLENTEKNTVLLTVIILVILGWAGLFRADRFYTLSNFVSMAYQIPEFGILSLGMTICMISGGIDLSLVGNANLCAVVAAIAVTRTESGLFAVIAAILTGAVCGCLNGILVGVMGIPAMLVTLGGLQIFTGLATAITKGSAITGIPETFLFLGNGLLWGTIPVSLVVFIAIVLILMFLMKYSVYGQQLYMLGTNTTASRYSGTNNIIVNLITYILSGIVASLAGIIMCSRYGSANADYGSSYTLLTLLIAVLGGIDPDGGKGKIFGVMLSVFILQLISSIFNILRFSSFLKTCIWGLILIVVMIINYWLAAGVGFHIQINKKGN